MNFADNQQKFDMNMHSAIVINEEGGYYIPSIKQESPDSFTVAFTPSDEEMPVIPPQPVSLYVPKDGKDGEKGDRGEQGAPGYTPQRGVDYWTTSDKKEIVDDVIEQIPETSSVVKAGTGTGSTVSNDTANNKAEGVYSSATNYNTKATGKYTTASGTTTTASGAAAFAANCGTEASGDVSAAFGNYTKASTTYAFATGDEAEANGIASFAANYKNKANGQNSFATGSTNTVTGKTGFVAGASNTVSGESSSAFGLMNDVSGKYSNAFGQQNVVTGNYSNAQGYNQKNKGHFASTFGHSTEVYEGSYNQSAFGTYNKASSDSLFMIGNGTSDTARKNAFEVKSNGTVMIGAAALTEEKVNSIGTGGGTSGNLIKAGPVQGSVIINDLTNNRSDGFCSTAEGCWTQAIGSYSHAEGLDTIAASAHQHVQGKNNIKDATGKYAHIVGNGVHDMARSNAHTLDWDGVGWFAGGLKVGGTGQDDENAVDILAYIQALEERINALEG